MKSRVKGIGYRAQSKKTVISFLLICILLLSACTKQEKVFKKDLTAMDTFITITVVSDSSERAEAAIDAAFDEIKRLELLINYYSPDSELSAINRAAGKSSVKVSDDTLEMLQMALDISDRTGGAFNPAIGSVIKLWDFSRQAEEHAVPSKESINKVVTLIDYRKVKIDDKKSEVFLQEEGMELDLGGIAKGYAADKAVEAIKSKGIKAALVAIAGDIKGYGIRPDGEAWRVGVQNPRQNDKDDELLTSLYLNDEAISTSGDYFRFFTKEGKRYHHIIDPRTGYPAESNVISVSVIASEGYVSDGISTGVFVLGTEEGIELLESMGIEGILVDSEMKVFLTNGLKGKLEMN